MTTLRTVAEVRRALGPLRPGTRIGLVPTMGALHDGHMSLLAEARRRGCEHLAISVFVNPLQFGPEDDFERYPRTLDDDVARCVEAGVSTVFTPSPAALYPPGFGSSVEVEGVTAPLEGLHRPGHFRGVTTIVAKLFNLTGPCVAVFGRKDYQQYKTLERMARDLDLPVEVVGAPIVREPDGLALSSRNRYLSATERTRALAISGGLRAAWRAFERGERSAEALLDEAYRPIAAQLDGIDYVALVDADDLTPLSGPLATADRPDGRALLAVAAHLGRTRLIDNLVLGEDPPPPGD